MSVGHASAPIRIRRRRLRSLVAVAAVPVLAMCGSAAASASAAHQSRGVHHARMLPLPSYAVASTSPNWVSTPNGYVYRSCAHQVPRGGRVDAAGDIVVGTVVHKVGHCPYSGPVRKPGPSGERSLRPASTRPYTNGWWTDSWWNHSWLTYLTATWTVPKAPASAPQTLFFFPSFENSAGTSIDQPVLQYGVSQAGGGNYWSMAAWYLSGSHTYYSTLDRVYTGDTITGTLSASNCNSDGTHCFVENDIGDLQRDTDVGYAATTPEKWASVQGGVMENYGVSSCKQLSASNSISFHGITVHGAHFTKITPSFGIDKRVTSCGATGSATSTSTKITWSS